MTHPTDPFAAHMLKLTTDASFRAAFIADAASGLEAEFGYVPRGAFEIDVVEQHSDTVTILLPARPAHPEHARAALESSADRVFDILYTSGVGGYLIPDTALTWAIRDMRTEWVKHLGL